MLEILQFDFMRRAFIAGTLLGAVAPIIGIFLVVRRYSLLADTLAHVSLLGVALGLLANINPIFSALAVSLLASLGIDRLRTSGHLPGESALALFLSGSLAIAIVLLALAKGFTVDLLSMLFGSITTISPQELLLVLSASLLIAGIVYFLYKELFFISYDEEAAAAQGMNVQRLNAILLLLAALLIALSIRIVGVLLISALMVIPVLTAMQYGRSFKYTLFLSIVFSLAAVISGLVLSYYLNLPSGGAIVLVSLIVFLASLLKKSLSQ